MLALVAGAVAGFALIGLFVALAIAVGGVWRSARSARSAIGRLQPSDALEDFASAVAEALRAAGGIGTAGCSDPRENLAGILLTQRMMESPVPPRVMTDFWTLAYQTIEE